MKHSQLDNIVSAIWALRETITKNIRLEIEPGTLAKSTCVLITTPTGLSINLNSRVYLVRETISRIKVYQKYIPYNEILKNILFIYYLLIKL